MMDGSVMIFSGFFVLVAFFFLFWWRFSGVLVKQPTVNMVTKRLTDDKVSLSLFASFSGFIIHFFSGSPVAMAQNT
jgi:hypothetical protein